MSQVDEATRRQSDWILVALASVGTAIVVTDAQARVISMNSVAETLTGWPRGEAAGQSLSDVFRIENDETRRAVASPVAEALASGTTTDVANDTILRGRYGTDCILDGSAVPIRDGAGVVVGAVLLFRDVTDRRRLTTALEVSEARYRRLFETAQDGILIVDAQSRRIFDANPFLTDLIGYSQDDLVGKELWEIGLFRDVEASKEAFRVLQGGGYIRYEDLPLRTKDGRQIEVEFVSNVYWVGDHQVVQCNIRDISDRKRAESALGVAFDQLEERVRERTAELAATNETLSSAIAARERAEAARRDVVRRLATAQEDERRRIARELHDQIGQYLAALGLGLKALETAAPEASSADQQLRHLRGLTDLIGTEVHNLALEIRPTALDDLGLSAALSTYAEEWATRSGVKVDFQNAGVDGERLPPAVETAVYRVVQEAMTNVLRHARASHVSLVLQRTSQGVVAVVEDDGRGFDPAAASQTSGRLGLLGMRERVELVEGHLTVESAPGGGTTVIARIPLRADGEAGHV